MWDLFSGFGGASHAFANNPDWLVIRFENNPELQDVPLTENRDVSDWRIWYEDYPHPDFIWASPPCLEFSQAFNAPRSIARREGREFEADLSAVLDALDLIEELNPKNWCVENVKGAIPDFANIPALGSPMNYQPFFLWGDIPPLILPRDFKHRKSEHDKRWSPLRSNHRAKIPVEISAAVLDAITNQLTLGDFI